MGPVVLPNHRPGCRSCRGRRLWNGELACKQVLHALLAHRRFEARREFFTLTHAEARAVFLTVELIAGRTEGANQSTEEARATENTGPRPPRKAAYCHSPPLAVSWDEKDRLRSWVESNYTHIPLREKDTGTKLNALFSAYASATPPVHQKLLGKTTFGKMLGAVYPGIGPHKNGAGTVSGLFLLR